jgi:hypothetical protein
VARPVGSQHLPVSNAAPGSIGVAVLNVRIGKQESHQFIHCLWLSSSRGPRQQVGEPKYVDRIRAPFPEQSRDVVYLKIERLSRHLRYLREEVRRVLLCWAWGLCLSSRGLFLWWHLRESGVASAVQATLRVQEKPRKYSALDQRLDLSMFASGKH